MKPAAEAYLGYEPGDEAAANAVSQQLESVGMSVWKHQQRLETALYRAEALDRLSAADMVVILWTRRSRESAWVLDEADAGARRKVLFSIEADAAIPIGYETSARAKIRMRGDQGHIGQPHRFQERLAAFAERLGIRRPKRLWQLRFWYVRLADILVLAALCGALAYRLLDLPLDRLAFTLSSFAGGLGFGALLDHCGMWLGVSRRAYRWRFVVRAIGETAGIAIGFVALGLVVIIMQGRPLPVGQLAGMLAAMAAIGAVIAAVRLIPLLMFRWLQVRLLA